MWQVISDRFTSPAGTILSEADLSGCNIAAAVAGGHLTPVKPRRKTAETPERAEEQ